MIASARSPESIPLVADRRLPARAAWLALAVALACGCAEFAPAPVSPMEPLPRIGAVMPDEVDHATADLAAAILVDDRRLALAGAARLEAIDHDRKSRGELPSGLVPYALEATNACLDDPRDYRVATQQLLERKDLDATLRRKLQEVVDDDPLELASARIGDARMLHWGRIFNAIAEPAGRSMTNLIYLPVRLSASLLAVALAEYEEDDLTLHERQALDHWKRFVDAHPEAPESAELLARIEEAQSRWHDTQRDRSIKRANKALESGSPRLAGLMATRALRYSPEDPDALELLEEAGIASARQRELDRSALSVSDDPDFLHPAQRDLIVALWQPDGDIATAAAKLASDTAPAEPGPSGVPATLSDEASFIAALATAETPGGEEAAWNQVEELTDDDANMGRHARALYLNPRLHPWRAFGAAKRGAVGDRWRWLAFGPLAKGPRDRNLPWPVEWAVELPTMVGVVTGVANRALRFPFMKTDWSKPAVLARRYLEREPAGAHADEARHWLRRFEKRRGNYVAALDFSEALGDLDEEQLADLREDAANQALQQSLNSDRRDVRHQLLRQVAQRFQGTAAGQQAGEQLRTELEKLGSQSIRISREYLKENPEVAGPEGIALQQGLLDGDPTNGELHPEGVALLGGRVVEFSFVGESGRDRKPPRRVRRRISDERLARLVSQLEESSLEMALTDRDVPVEHDADRDIFFERARLGLVQRPDMRPHAESSYTFRGARERFGLVRGRESILPFEIVLQGSFDDFGLGAFPRMRMPRTTPDSFLYRD